MAQILGGPLSSAFYKGMNSHSPANSFLGGLDSSRRWTAALICCTKEHMSSLKNISIPSTKFDLAFLLLGLLEVETVGEAARGKEATSPTNPQILHSFRCPHSWAGPDPHLLTLLIIMLICLVCQMATPAAWYKKPWFQRWLKITPQLKTVLMLC